MKTLAILLLPLACGAPPTVNTPSPAQTRAAATVSIADAPAIPTTVSSLANNATPVKQLSTVPLQTITDIAPNEARLVLDLQWDDAYMVKVLKDAGFDGGSFDHRERPFVVVPRADHFNNNQLLWARMTLQWQGTTTDSNGHSVDAYEAVPDNFSFGPDVPTLNNIATLGVYFGADTNVGSVIVQVPTTTVTSINNAE